uniref:Plectin/eS10 N-terminal domain-containing protein n=1 Tax=Zea mays TaxID=4577 RepID=A0A804NNT6_MAIZE
MAARASDYLTVEYHSRELPSFPSDDEGGTAGSGVLIIPKKNRNEICKGRVVCQEGLQPGEASADRCAQPPGLQVIKLMQSFKSKEYVRETFSWQYYYWYLTNDGIEHLRNYLNLRSEIVPATLKKSAKPPGRPFGSGPPGDRPRERRDLVWGRREEMRG